MQIGHQRHGYCVLCDGPCESGIAKPHASYPFVAEVDREPDPSTTTPKRTGGRRRRRAKRPTEDRMRRLEDDR